MNAVLRTALSILVLMFSALSASAEKPKVVEWTALIPESDPITNPLSVLTPEQTYDFDIVASYRQQGPEYKFSDNKGAAEEVQKSERLLREQGIDIDALILQWQDWRNKQNDMGKELVTDLDGQLIKIAGYLMPLEFSEKGEKDFLLVPYVGACIHVPPPPPNQLIFIKLDKPFRVEDIYTPVWVTGTMQTKSTKKALNLADGSADVSVGYSLAGKKIEPYSDK